MGGVARSELVVAVTEAGGFGFLGMVREPPELIRAECLAVRARTQRRFGVNLIPAATNPELLHEQIRTCIDLEVSVVCLFWDLALDAVQALRAANIVVACQVGSVDEAKAAQGAGAQIVVAQGREAGGHVRGHRPRDELLVEVLCAVGVPVLAAGGIVDGADVARVMALGAQGAMLGTAMIATPESFAHRYHKDRIVAAHEGEARLTDAFHINWPPGAPTRALENSVIRRERGNLFHSDRVVIGHDGDRPIYLFSTDSPLRSMTGDFEAMALYAGEGASRIQEVQPAADRLTMIASDAAKLLSVTLAAPVERVELSSPVCYIQEFAASYLDLASDGEVVAALNELLEAERAGARVAMGLAKDVADPALKLLAEAIRRDEVRWCGVLMRAILVIDGVPSSRTGDFYAKAAAIEDVQQRMRYLNRGQGWVVRRLQALIPRLVEGRTQDELAQMLAAHAENIEMVNAFLGGLRRG